MNDVVTRLTTALSNSYRIERELGQGGMATVYLAEDIKHHRKVAIKVLKPELAAVLGAERFVQEITTTAALQHPHILPLFDSGTADGFLFYVMPFIDGETLRDKLNRETQLGIDEAVKITVEVADALHHAHSNGVVHRDIKPENILLANGRPMVADFGIALAVSAAAGGRMTETGLSLGTPHYMSPEQATAEKEISARSDVYSLGSVLYEMLTGNPPHTGASAQQIIMKIVTEEAAPVTKLRKSVPNNVAAAVAKAIEKLPADRFESAAAFAQALTNTAFTVANTMDAALAAGGFGSRRRRRAQLATAAVCGVVVASVGWLLLRGEGAPSQIVRFELTLPATQRMAHQFDHDAPFALSPDGKKVVYVATDSGAAATRLYIRSLDQLVGVPLQGTEGGVAPFFSPDGLWVGFITEEDLRLKKVPVTGGAAITLATDVQNRFGSGSWGEDGFIVYTSSGYSISRVPGTGGAAAILGSRNQKRNEGLFWPTALPGGKVVLLTSCNNNCTDNDLAALDVATGTITVLVAGAGRGWYLGDGVLVYSISTGELYAVPFDAKKVKILGPAVPVLDDVRSGVGHGSKMAISHSGAMLYVPGTGVTGVRVVEIDRSGAETLLLERVGNYEHPRWSPTRDRIALTVTSEGASQVWVYDVRSETLSQLTFEGSNYRPTWSPDGKRIAYYRTVGDTADLYWVPADLSSPSERVADGEDTMNGSTTFWTRDGQWILVDGLKEFENDQEDIFAIGTGTNRARQSVVETVADEQAGAVSPDGKWVAYGSNEGGQWQVYLRPFLAAGGRWLVSTAGGATPLWASNNEVIFVDNAERVLASATLEFGSTVRVGSRKALFSWDPYVSGGSSSPSYDVSWDGQRILALKRPESARRLVAPIVVLHWVDEVKRLMAEQGGE